MPKPLGSILFNRGTKTSTRTMDWRPLSTTPPMVDLATRVQYADEPTVTISHSTPTAMSRIPQPIRWAPKPYAIAADRTARTITADFSLHILDRSMGWLSNDEKVPNWNSLPKLSVASSGKPMQNANPRNNLRLQTTRASGASSTVRGFQRRPRCTRARTAIAHRPSCELLRSSVPPKLEGR